MTSDPRRTSLTNCISILVCLIVFAATTSIASGQSLNELRLKASEATGGTNLYSRNFGWGTSLVSLPGRSGLDAGLGISYNSNIWIKAAATSEMIYNPDSSNVGPGFKFGYSTIEYPYYDSNAGAYAFIMVGADGSRTEFRQIGGGDDFEPGDSSYRLLRVGPGTKLDGKAADIDITVYNTDGTQMHYLWKSGHYRLEEIKDRNGNYIMMDYSSTGGRLTKVTDTLGREINIAYDTGGYPTTITQTWKDTNGSGTNVTHTYATFAYTNVTVSTNFGSLTVTGPANSTTVKVPDTITYADGSKTKFEYNGYVQVKKISNIAADSGTHVLNYVETDLADVSGTQSDVPRISETRSWAENFNGGTAVVVKNTLTASQSYDLGGTTGTATRIQVWVDGHPENLRSNTFVYASGWNESLPIGTEDCITTSATCTTQKRWTWNQWTQDNTSVSYILNPRITESQVGDGVSTKRTEIDYGSNGYGLPETVEVYNGTASIPMKKSVTTYNLSSTYTDRQIIGLPSMVENWGYNDLTSSLEYVGKVTYAYDEGDFSGSGQTITPTKHDGTNYGSSFIAGRGNLTTVKRWDMAYPTTESAATVSTVKYNTAGSVVSKTTPWYSTYTRTVSISYTDNFNSTVSPATYAYPTTITDPNSQSSTVKYRYDIGANVEATSPAPAGQTYGKTSKRVYDSIGRLERDSVYVNTTEKFYTRYEYSSVGTHSKVYSTITDVSGSTAGPDTADEVLSEQFTDGAGRVIKSRSPHTFSGGSTATWSGIKVEYDLLGRVKKQSVPTEIDSNFDPTGDDATRGYLWTHQKYDWKGRVVRKINTDGIDQTTLNDSDIIISYEGCGCAGGQITTIESERVPYGTSSFGRRKQKVYEDILGRSWKTESFDWDGSTVYSTQTQLFNGRDQAVRTRQYSGTDSSGTFQDYTASYDGFGRVYLSHKPEQRDDEDTLTYTSYTYNPDDSISTVMDARGGTTTYTYNSRGLVTHLEWSGSGLTIPDDVTFSYDNLGNRTQMTDGLGQVDYEYDSLSRMIAETRDFTDNLPSAPISGSKYKFEYTYDLSGLKSYKEPFGETVTYTNDKVGRLTQVAGAWSGGSQTYANNPHYRAWGALQNLDYGNGTEMNVTAFNNRLQAAEFEVKKDSTSIISKEYEFYADGQMKLSTDNNNAKFDRLFKYDHQARVTNVASGAEARGSTDTAANIPFGNTFGYNAFDNQTTATNKHFTNTSGGGFSHTYANNRISGLGNGYYDVDGRQIRSVDNGFKTYSYNAAGQMSSSYYEHRPNSTLVYENFETMTYSGDGQVVKIATLHDPVEGDSEADTNYQIRSTVLGGQTITKVQSGGQKLESSIVAAGTVVATHGFDWINWRHNDPNSDSVRSTNASGVSSGAGDDDFAAHELDGQGRSVGFTNPYSNDPQWDNIPDLYQAQQSIGQMINGMPVTHKFNGLNVPEKYFQDMTEFSFFNIFGLQAQMAATIYKKLPGLDTHGFVPGENPLIPKGADAFVDFTDRGYVYRQYYEAVDVASWSVVSMGAEDKLMPLGDDEQKRLRSNVEAFEKDATCGKLIAAIMKALPDVIKFASDSWTKSNESVAKRFDTIQGSRGIWLVEGLGAPATYAMGRIKLNTSLMRNQTEKIAYLFDDKNISTVSVVREHTATSSATRAHEATITLIHELIHSSLDPLTNSYGHDTMDDAANEAVQKLGLNSVVKFKKTGNGTYFHAVMRENCKGVKL